MGINVALGFFREPLGKVKILSEGNVDFVRRKFHFLSEKNSFSFEQKNGPLRSIFSYTAV